MRGNVLPSMIEHLPGKVTMLGGHSLDGIVLSRLTQTIHAVDLQRGMPLATMTGYHHELPIGHTHRHDVTSHQALEDGITLSACRIMCLPRSVGSPLSLLMGGEQRAHPFLSPAKFRRWASVVVQLYAR